MEFIYLFFDKINGIKCYSHIKHQYILFIYDVSIVLSFGLFISIANGSGKL